jgi:uncharacterized protein YeaO (DUF488 family)
MITLKRVYEEPKPEDGFRVLVERLWPRGLTKARAAVDLWDRDVAPSPELRKWYSHDPVKWAEFQKRYVAELGQKKELVEFLRRRNRDGPVTFLYAAHDTERNSAVVLKRFVEQGVGAASRTR